MVYYHFHKFNKRVQSVGLKQHRRESPQTLGLFLNWRVENNHKNGLVYSKGSRADLNGALIRRNSELHHREAARVIVLRFIA